ncbi:TPA: hypothetical protein IAC10_07050 [Candidatus Scatousia excrementigallinarum]|uniref:Uncharacterized protein n=2 Tax=Bacteria incertae sedis TaxID=2323 RepID=A0A9D1FXW9_9BACT|nr:hypothetical protein [Candidatus Scatousia excrementigallinarum]HIS83476.1 hypothetical protein [Candidatus Scatenecus faecavium]
MPTTEKMNEQTSQVLGNQFFGEFESDQERQKKECAIIGLMKNQIIVLEEQLNDAKIKFAEANLVKDNWSCAKEREIDCKILEGQINILSKLQYDLEDMFSPTPAC